MKKKILFALGTIVIAVVLTFNVGIAKNSTSPDLSLNMISNTAIAQAEDTGNLYCRYCYQIGRCGCYGEDGAGSCMGICYGGNYYCS
jgi:hypothetical protein